MKIGKQWYTRLMKEVSVSATKEIRGLFPQSRFVVINQKKRKKKVSRKIAFILGPYLLCTAENQTTLNDTVSSWVEKNAEKPLGQIISEKGLRLEKRLIGKGDQKRTYEYSGDVHAIITEQFHDIQEVSIGAYCGKVTNTTRDEQAAKDFVKAKKCDFYLFPEAFPFSRRPVTYTFPAGTVFGRYTETGPETYFTDGKKKISVHKSTLFANEKVMTSKLFKPTIIAYKGMRVAIIICYDLLNPQVSQALAKAKVDLILVSAMIPKKDLRKWERFVYTRGTENQCPVILCSAKDKRDITDQLIIHYDPISEDVQSYKKPQHISVNVGKRLIKSPEVHWSLLLKNEVYGPFVQDY